MCCLGQISASFEAVPQQFHFWLQLGFHHLDLFVIAKNLVADLGNRRLIQRAADPALQAS